MSEIIILSKSLSAVEVVGTWSRSGLSEVRVVSLVFPHPFPFFACFDTIQKLDCYFSLMQIHLGFCKLLVESSVTNAFVDVFSVMKSMFF